MVKIVYGGSVAFDELVGSPKIGAGREARSITREGRISWANIDAALAECFPAPPAIWGRHPTATYLYVESVEIEPFHPDAGNWMVCTGDVATYTAPGSAGYEAKMTVKYSLPPFPDVSQLISVKYAIGGEFQLVPPTGHIKWADTNATIDSSDIKMGKFIPTVEYSLTRHRAVVIPWAAIRLCIGKVNSATLNTYPFSNVGKETLLFAGAEISYSRDTAGNVQYSLDYRFHERVVTHPNVYDGPAGWNHVYREEDNTWSKVVSTSGDGIQYETSAAFLSLF